MSSLRRWTQRLFGTEGPAPDVAALVRDLSQRVSTQSDATIRAASARLGPLVGEVLRDARREVKVGATTERLEAALVESCLRRELAPAMLGFHGFPAAAAISVNEEIVHGVPSSRALRSGDLVKFEFAVVSGEAFAAQSWTVPVGTPSDEDAVLLTVGRRALDDAVAAVRPGARIGDIGAAIQGRAEPAGFSVVRAFVGHAMGKQRFQDPQVPGVGKAGIGVRLRPGTLLNLHVILKHGSPDVEVGPNGWTASAEDGRRGVLFTAMVDLSAEACARLTTDLDG